MTLTNKSGLLDRIGLFGGTFDPIHFGHLRAAQEAKEAFSLDQIILIPAALPPHKKEGATASGEDRLGMIRLAVSNAEGLTVSDVELQRGGNSYTIDTLRHFKGLLGQDASIFLLVGLDAFWEIDTWKSWRDLFALCPIIVLARPVKGDGNAGMYSRMSDFLASRIADGYELSPESGCYLHHARPPVCYAPVTALDISATQIRCLVKAGRSIKFLLPEKVETYIKREGLYR